MTREPGSDWLAMASPASVCSKAICENLEAFDSYDEVQVKSFSGVTNDNTFITTPLLRIRLSYTLILK